MKVSLLVAAVVPWAHAMDLAGFIAFQHDEFMEGDCMNPQNRNRHRGCRCDYLSYRIAQNEDILHGRFVVPSPPRKGGGKQLLRKTMDQDISHRARHLQTASATCTGGFATVGSTSFPCQNVNLDSWVSMDAFDVALSGPNTLFMDDIWGWTDPTSEREFAIVGAHDKFLFVEVTDPGNPVLTGYLLTRTSDWHDIKTYKNFAYMVSEATSHDMVVFSLCQLLTATPGTQFAADSIMSIGGSGRAHNIVINEDSGFAYIVGGYHGCGSGLYMVNIQDPANPTFAGCFSSDGYTHDAQCVIYNGPDVNYQGREICFACNEDTVTIVDVTNKTSPVQLSRTQWGLDYVHQGWLTEDHKYFLVDEEETQETTTKILDVSSLTSVPSPGEYSATVSSTDHNMYIINDTVYQANYKSGLRILKIVNPATLGTGAGLSEVGYFDTTPTRTGQGYEGMWSSYPYFPSGTIVGSDIYTGLFIMTPTGASVQTTLPIPLHPSATETTCPGTAPTTAEPTTSPTMNRPTSSPTVASTSAPTMAQPTSSPTITPPCTCANQKRSDCANFCGPNSCTWKKGNCLAA